jgi:hypothetical protein
MRQVDHREIKSEFPVFGDRVAIRRDERIDVADSRFHEAGITPQGRRPAVDQIASEAGWALTCGLIVLEQNVGWTDQPELMERIQFDRVAVLEDAGAPNERNIVIVDDIEAGFQDLSQTACLEYWIPGLLRGKRREKSEGALQAMDHDIRVVRRCRTRGLVSEQ